MARPARFSDDDVLDAALRAVAAHGPDATIAQVATELQGPVGSIYHRFGSREDLLARLWVRSVRRFHEALIPRLEAADSHDALVAGARFVVTYCDDQRAEAVALRLFDRDRLLAVAGLPEELRTRIRTVNDGVDDVVRGLTRRRYGRATASTLGRVHLATRVLPYGLVRPWLGQAVPAAVADAAEAGADAVLRLGDRPARSGLSRG